MKSLEHYVGQVLDEKYRLERLLGQGGMGAVYLATHLGTERYVALKLITPQFMRNEEFVERFKREARAAGRLRHPNVVDVTDFGFTKAGGERLAYLVMEYLDGCTLGDVLMEEKRLPLEWVVDILEQVCSALHEAHQQGIVHRDLKPDNIWLEPNRLGGYRVKVLDFGIAKLAEANLEEHDAANVLPSSSTQSTLLKSSRVTVAQTFDRDTMIPTKGGKPTLLGVGAEAAGALENETLVHHVSQNDEPRSDGKEQLPSDVLPANDADATQLFTRPTEGARVASAAVAPSAAKQPQMDNELGDDDDGDRTLMFDQATKRVALGAHTTSPAATSQGAALTRVGAIMGTPLYMSPEQCRGESLDARSDIYSLGVVAYQMLAGEPPFSGDMPAVMQEHINTGPQPLRERISKVPKRATEVVMAALAKDPSDRPQTAAAFASSLRAQAEGVGSLYRRAFSLYSEHFPKFLRLSLIAHIPVIVVTILMIGLQLIEKPLWDSGLTGKVVVITLAVIFVLAQIAGYFFAAAGIAGMTAIIVTQLSAAPLRPVELRSAFAVLKRRWKPLLKTAIRFTLRLMIGFVLLVVPGIIIAIRYALYAPVVLMEGLEKKAALKRARELASRSWRTVIIVSVLQFVIPMAVGALLGRVSIKINKTSGETPPKIYQQLTGLVNIFVVPLMSIVPALLYLKMRQLGGETLSAALAQIEEVDAEQSRWRQRMRTRLSLHTPRGQKPTG